MRGGKAVKKTPHLMFGLWSKGEGDDEERVAMKKEGRGVRVRWRVYM
jgi:hypothetical protein